MSGRIKSRREYEVESTDLGVEQQKEEIIQIRRTPFQKVILATRELFNQSLGPKLVYGFAGFFSLMVISFFFHDFTSASQNEDYYTIDQQINSIRALPDGQVKQQALLAEAKKALDLCDSMWQTKHATAGCLLAASIASELKNNEVLIAALDAHRTSGAPESTRLFSTIQLGYAYENEKEYEKALELYDDILPTLISSKLAEPVQYRKAEIYVQQNKYDLAIEQLNKILESTGDPQTTEQAQQLLVYAMTKSTQSE